MKLRILAAALAALTIAGTAPAALRDSLNSSTLYWENDAFGLGRNKTDRFYTNGVRFTAQLSDPVIQNWTWTSTLRDAMWNHLGGIALSQPAASVNLVFGQNFYTPQIITIAAPQPQDRPWAGVLYGGLAESATDADLRRQLLLELDAGILGPGAGAQRTQKYVHNQLGFSNNDPQGWHNQIRNEPVLSLRYQQLRRYPFVASGDTDVFDALPHFGAQLGTPQTFVNAGATLRLGYHVSGLPVGVIPGTASAGAPAHKIEFYLFGGGEGRWVPFNATLDGGLFHDGPKANGPKRFVTDVRAGFSARYKWTRLTYSIINRSAEFDVPPGRVKNQRFGSFALTIEPLDNFR